MDLSVIATYLIYLALGAILISLATGLYYLVAGRHNEQGVFKSLAVRITLSMLLFLLILLAVYLGWITPAPPPLY
jgi:hypothetical protein